MNFLKTTDTGGFPWYLDDFRWAESGYVAQILAILKSFKPRDLQSLVGYTSPPATDFIIWGCEVSGGSGTYSWTAGAVFIDGQVYSVDASPAPVTISVFAESFYFNPTVTWVLAGNKVFQDGPPAKDTYGIRKATVDVEPIVGTAKLSLFHGDRFIGGYSSADRQWTTPPLHNANYTTNGLAWKANEFGDIVFRSGVTRVANGNSTITILPTRARPAVARTFPLMDISTIPVAMVAYVTVDPGGYVQVFGQVPIGAQYDLSIIRFRAGE